MGGGGGGVQSQGGTERLTVASLAPSTVAQGSRGKGPGKQRAGGIGQRGKRLAVSAQPILHTFTTRVGRRGAAPLRNGRYARAGCLADTTVLEFAIVVDICQRGFHLR